MVRHLNALLPLHDVSGRYVNTVENVILAMDGCGVVKMMSVLLLLCWFCSMLLKTLQHISEEAVDGSQQMFTLLIPSYVVSR